MAKKRVRVDRKSWTVAGDRSEHDSLPCQELQHILRQHKAAEAKSNSGCFGKRLCDGGESNHFVFMDHDIFESSKNDGDLASMP